MLFCYKRSEFPNKNCNFFYSKNPSKNIFIKIRVDFNYRTTNHCTSGEIILLLIYFCCCLLPRSYTTFFVLLLLLLLLAVAAHLLLFRFYFHSIHKNTQNFFFVSAHCNFHGSFSRLLLVGLVCFKIKLWKSQRVVHEQSNKLCYGYYFFRKGMKWLHKHVVKVGIFILCYGMH